MAKDEDKLSSVVKHLILKGYIPAWAKILGSLYKELNYFDCYAGPGKYPLKDQEVDGSPIIVTKECAKILLSNNAKLKNINLIFVENNKKQKTKLETEINKINVPKSLKIIIKGDDSEKIIENILSRKQDNNPSFFFIDPYGHPFSLSLMGKMMKRQKIELMVNFMYYQIIRDIPNPLDDVKKRCKLLFDPDDPAKLDLKTFGTFDSNKMLKYLHNRIGAKYYIPFSVNFSPEEKFDSDRLKYLLIHYSNDFIAFQKMLAVMWKHSEEGKPLMVSDNQPVLFPWKDINDLRKKIKETYIGTEQTISFKNFIENNWEWYYLEKHYRKVLKEFERDKMILINRKTSSQRGLDEDDEIFFYKPKQGLIC